MKYIPDVKYTNRHNWIDLPLRISGFSSANIAVCRCVNHLHLSNFVHVLHNGRLTKYTYLWVETTLLVSTFLFVEVLSQFIQY